ncbi:MAG: tetratricopeptide repeat protein, partial [Chloroflexi bacterium]|nr:tetratricopeptide repeat protein [Chloroflexota bacterium]
HSSLYARGTALLSLGRHAEADRDFERLVTQAEDPALQQASRRMLGLSLIQQGRELEASRNYETLAAQATDLQERAEYLLLLAELYHGLKAYDQVVRICGDIVALVSAGTSMQGGQGIEEKALFLLGDAQNRLGDYAAVTDTYQEALRRSPDSIYAPDMTFASGLSRMQMGQLDEAVVQFERFLERYQSDANAVYALYYLGHIQFSQREFEPALRAFERLVAEFPEHEAAGDVWFRIGECHFNLGRYERALSAYGAVLDDRRPGPEQDDALYNSAWAYMELNRGEDAVASMKRLLAEFPDSPLAPSAQFTIGDHYYNEGQYEQALEAYQGLARDYPNDELVAEVPELVEDLREAMAFTRYQEIVLDFRQAMAGEDDESLRSIVARMERLAAEYPNTETEVAVLNNMGISYESLNEWKLAVGVYDRVIARHDAGIGTPEAAQFARQHRDWIVAYRL